MPPGRAELEALSRKAKTVEDQPMFVPSRVLKYMFTTIKPI